MHRPMSPELRKCIEACQKCHNVCLLFITHHCLEMGGKHVEPMHVRLMMDCANSCQTAVEFMLRESPFHDEVCRLCALVCDACAQSCEQKGDMDDCVKACRHCADLCRQAIKATVVAEM